MNTVYRVHWVYYAQHPSVTGTVSYKSISNHKTFRLKSNAASFQKRINEAYNMLVMPHMASIEEITLEDTMAVLETDITEDNKPVLVDWTE